MAHLLMLDKEVQQYPRIKKYLKRSRAVDGLRSLSKFCNDTSVPEAHVAHVFLRHYDNIYDSVLQSIVELDEGPSNSSSSVFDMFKKNKEQRHSKFDDSKPPLYVLLKLIRYQRQRFRRGWKLTSLESFLTAILRPTNRHEYRMLGLDLLLAIIDVLRSRGQSDALAEQQSSAAPRGGSRLAGSNTGENVDGAAAVQYYHTPFIHLLGHIFNPQSTLWSGAAVAASHKMLFAIATENDGKGETTTDVGGIGVSTSSSSKSNTVVTQTLELAGQVFSHASAHKQPTSEELQRLCYWYDIVLQTIAPGAFGFNPVLDASTGSLTGGSLRAKHRGGNVEEEDGTSKDKEEPEAVARRLATSVSFQPMNVAFVELRLLLVKWMVGHLFVDSFAAIALSSITLCSLLFALLRQLFPSNQKSVEWSSGVQMFVLKWYASLVTPENRHGLFQTNPMLFENVYFPFMLEHAAESMQVRGGSDLSGGAGGAGSSSSSSNSSSSSSSGSGSGGSGGGGGSGGSGGGSGGGGGGDGCGDGGVAAGPLVQKSSPLERLSLSSFADGEGRLSFMEDEGRLSNMSL